MSVVTRRKTIVGGPRRLARVAGARAAPLVCLAGVAWLVGPALPGSAAPAQGNEAAGLRQELEALRAQMNELQVQMQEIERRLEAVEEPAATLEQEPEPDEAAAESGPAVIGGAAAAGIPQTELPDISVIGNIVGLASSDGTRENRNDVLVRELELGLQGYLYPQVRADAFISLEQTHDYAAELEEAYVSLLDPSSLVSLRWVPQGLALRLGRKRLDFGRVNPVHPHHWDYVNSPVVITDFLGDHALIGDGVQADYLLAGETFGSLQLGAWRIAPHAHNHDEDDEHTSHVGPGVEGRLYTGRLWTSRVLGEKAELELGASGAWGRGAVKHHHDEEHEEHGEEVGQEAIRLYGLDLTYKRWPAAHQRLLLQAEALWHRRASAEAASRFGYYLFGNYRWSKYADAGLLWSRSQQPWPLEGSSSALSAILTNHLTETTALRLQLDLARRPEVGRVTELWLQLVWGIGPHSHLLQ